MSRRQGDKEAHYKDIINKQKKIIQDLKKKAARGSKSQERFDDLELELLAQMEDELEKDTTKAYNKDDRCPDCGKGTLEFVDLKVRKMFICSNCNYRQVKK